MMYDDNNIFAKILREEIPCKKIYEDDFVLSFYDINPQKKIHALVIPKGKYIDLDDFSNNASSDEIVGLLKGEIPCKKIYEDEFVLSFYDINPQKKIHALIIPKGKYIDLDDFSNNASSDEMVGLLKGINIVAKKLGISVDTGRGYRALANISEDGGQEVPHLHFHLFGGEKVGKMVS